MEIDDLMRDTFTAREHLAPDEAEVLAAVHRRTGSRRVKFARPLAVAASIAVVAGAAGGAAALSRHHDNGTGLAQSSARSAGVSAPPTAGATTSTATASTGPASGIAALTMPFDLGWLPQGSVRYIARRTKIGGAGDTSRPSYDGEYLMTVTTGGHRLDIDVAQFPGGLEGTSFKSGRGHDITINGRRGIESAHSGGPGGYEIYFLDSDGGLMYVNVGPHLKSTASAAEYTAIGRRIARGVRFPGTAQVTPTFGLVNLPDGLRVLAFDVESLAGSGLPASNGGRGNGTIYQLGSSATLDPPVQVGVGNVIPQRGGAVGRSVQGHPTRHLDDHGFRSLEVRDAVHGESVVLQGRVSLSELYAVADGLVLPS